MSPHRLLGPLLIALLAFAAPGLAQAYVSTICITTDILTDDSGRTVAGVTEDWWALGDDPTSSVGYPLPGVRIELKMNNGAGASIGVWDTDPASGCKTVSNGYLGPYQVIVYGYATDSGGNHVRIHTNGDDTDTESPGTTYSTGFINAYLTPSLLLKVDGVGDEKWTTFAAAAQTLYRYHDGLSGKTLSIGFDSQANCTSTTSYDQSNDYIEEGAGYSLIKYARCATNNQTKSKFLVAHELGHAIGRQYYGYNGNDQSDSGFAASSCVPTSGVYSMTSAEFDSVSFKEGYAHFVSARVWNNQASTGTFTFFNTGYDLESGPNNNAAGGWIGTMCPLDDDKDGVSTNYDWLRFFWDFYTQTGCNSTPTKLEMQRIYYWVRENDRTGTFPTKDGSPGPSNFHDAVYDAITNELWDDFAGCTVTLYMDHNCVGGRKLSGALCN